MNIGDEGTGAHLKATVREEKTVAGMDGRAATRIVNESFRRWGLPLNIKIDNGYPFVNPNFRNVPSKGKLWWIGLGINVIQNTPGRPQENGIVECLQGTICSWSNPGGQNSIDALQSRIDEESDFQRDGYRIPARGYKTRIELYPELETNQRIFDPDNFDMQRVYDYLSLQVWQRRIRSDGTVKIFNHVVYVGKKYAGHIVTVTLDPIEKEWIFRDGKGTELKTSNKGVPQEPIIKEFALGKKHTT